jgi:flagellar hook protein FlgE
MGSVYLTALSGLQANSLAINMTSNNLANLNTTGFKSQDATFSDLLANEMDVPGMTTALGTAQPAATWEFQQGAVQTGQAPLDAAIATNPNAFFVSESAGGPVYTRAGDFQAGSDAAGNNVLLSQSGNVVQGYAIGAGGQVSATMSEIVLPTNNTPVPTSSIDVQANLDSGTAAGGTTGFSQTVDDAQGNTHTLTLSFTRGTTPGNWTLAAEVDGQATPGSAQLQFDSSGNLTSPASFAIDANGQTITMPLVDSNGKGLLTQLASPSAAGSFTQNGTAASDVTSYAVEDGGEVVATCADGSAINVAQLALAQIGNPETMTALGNGDFKTTANTMAPYVGNAAATGTQVVGSALEQSTTDMAGQLSNLMVYQRAYEANSRALTTNDQMEQDLYQLVG